MRGLTPDIYMQFTIKCCANWLIDWLIALANSTLKNSNKLLETNILLANKMRTKRAWKRVGTPNVIYSFLL